MRKTGIIGAGHLGMAIAHGITETGAISAENVYLYRREMHKLQEAGKKGFSLCNNLEEIVDKSGLIILCVLPQQVNEVLLPLSQLNLQDKLVVSTVTGVPLQTLQTHLAGAGGIVRAMPNTAIAVRQSMTCLVKGDKTPDTLAREAEALFSSVGRTAFIREDQMEAATALNACGIAFFMRAVRAAAQGGTETGFHAAEALEMAAQTALGAAALILRNNIHPESGIDHVTSPSGCTIAGLNEMEHNGFSSSLIKGITKACRQAGMLYSVKE